MARELEVSRSTVSGWLNDRHAPRAPAAVGKAAVRVLGPGWGAHSLRHRFATRAYAGGRDLLAVQALLGHSKPETTKRYTEIPDGALADAVNAI